MNEAMKGKRNIFFMSESNNDKMMIGKIEIKREEGNVDDV
jgi:hypothetical protein